MKAEIISVGTELLLGDVINTNASYLSQKLAGLGISCYHHSVVGDNSERLKDQLNRSLSRSELVIITGGLGPTYDDMTKETVAEVLGSKLVFDLESEQRIHAIFKKSKHDLTENNMKQAYTIEGAVVLQNDNGTAPGVYVEKAGKIVILLPGPPSEMKPMFENKVSDLLKKLSDNKLISRNIYMIGIGESNLESILHKEMQEGTNPTIAPYSFGDGLVIRVTASAKSETEALALIKPVEEKITSLFSKYVYSVDVPLIEEVIIKELSKRKLKVATAESCTGGLLSQRLTSISGASEVFNLGVVTYSYNQKINILKVDAETIKSKGAVSEAVAQQMATQILKLGNADIGLAITGVAGPKSSENKPVGLVYIALASKDKVITKELNLSRGYSNERQRIRQASTTRLLKMLYDYLKES